MTDLREADSLLQKAIKKVDDSIKLDSAQVEFLNVHSVISLVCCTLWSGPDTSSFAVAAAGGAAMHSGTESLNEGGAGGHSPGHSAEGRRGRTGPDEERGLQVPTVWGLQVSHLHYSVLMFGFLFSVAQCFWLFWFALSALCAVCAHTVLTYKYMLTL